MRKLNSTEVKVIFISSGLLLGVFISLLINLIFVAADGLTFTFSAIHEIHSELPQIYLIYLLIPLFMLVGYLFSRYNIHYIEGFDELEYSESKKNEAIKASIHNLTVGNLNAEIKDSSIDTEIRESMLLLQKTLQDNRSIEQKRRFEDKQQNWMSEGIAQFGDIMRTHTSNFEELGYAVISHLVRYLDINQGGFFMTVAEDGNKYLDLIASHAYERKKFPDKRIEWGEGLIGAVALEKKSYLTNKITDGYLTITSGLGRANPSYLLIVPLVLNEEVFGILELASFSPIEDFQIKFIERIAENTATSLNIMESNIRTSTLLVETQEQTVKLAQQEEKVRQNIKELKSTQFEAARQSEKFISFTNSVNHTLIRAEYGINGVLLYANTRFLKKLGYSGNKEVEGKYISMFINEKDREWFNSIWAGLAKGGAHFEGYMKHITKMGQDLWTMATYTCVRRDDGEIDKILFLAIDTTEQKKQSLDFEGQLEAINQLSPKAEFKPDGRILSSNKLFNETLKFSEKELLQKNIFDFISTRDQERFNEIWEQVITKNVFQGQLRMLSKYEEDVWFRATFTSVDDMYGDLAKVVFLAYEITKEREMELSARDQHELLIKKEEEMRLLSLDLKKQIHEMNLKWNNEKSVMLEEKKMFADILQELPYPVISINNLGFIMHCNNSAENYWGVKSKEVVNNKATILFAEKQDSKLIEAFIDPAKPVKEVKFEKTILALEKSTEERNISILKTEVKNEMFYTLVLHSE
jgi:PAS domain S-box-containing protein